MGRNRYSRGTSAQPPTHESTRRPRGEGRLDPVRWRRPGRGTLFRLAAVAALLVTAAAVLWSPPRKSCGAGVTPRSAPTDGKPGAKGSRLPTGGGTAEPGNGTAQAGSGSGSGDGSAQAGGGSDRTAQAGGAGTGQASGDGMAYAGGAGGTGQGGDGTAQAGGSDEAHNGAGQAVPEGKVGVPIRLADPTALALVHPGNRVDLLRIDGAGSRPTAVAGSVLVLRVTGVNDLATGGLLLALTPQEADKVVAPSRQGFAIVIRPG